MKRQDRLPVRSVALFDGLDIGQQNLVETLFPVVWIGVFVCHRSLGLFNFQQLAELVQAPKQETHDGRLAALHLLANLGDRESF